MNFVFAVICVEGGGQIVLRGTSFYQNEFFVSEGLLKITIFLNETIIF